MVYSDEDMIDVESGDEDFFSDDDGGSDNYRFDEEDMKQSLESYVTLMEEDIRKQQRDDIVQVSTVLSLSQVEAIVLLLHYQWSVSKVQDEWFTDEERIRKTVGILKEPIIDVNDKEINIQCGICFESYTPEEIARVSCGHPYCKTCWNGYISTKIEDGPECLKVVCPEPTCTAAVGQDMIDKVTKKKEDKEKYYRYFLRSYVEDGKKLKWCPSPGCEYAIDFGGGCGNGSSSYDVSCLCSYRFCWNCSEEAHSPVDCDTVSKWLLKNWDEYENMKWIIARTKPCPKCKRPIEKNSGCNFMRCPAPCKFGFCWTCLEETTSHGPCNKFVEVKTEAEVKKTRAIDMTDSHRYVHYYKRWAFNKSSRIKAMKDLKEWQSVQLKKLSDKQGKPETQLKFFVEAWLQIIECRRVLKWTYAYGYYLPTHEKAKRQFFEYLQGEAETGLERLHHCAETELNQFILKTDEDPTKDFDGFRMKLTGLTIVTKTYFENLMKALENGLADVAYNNTESTTNSKTGVQRQNLVQMRGSSLKRGLEDILEAHKGPFTGQCQMRR